MTLYIVSAMSQMTKCPLHRGQVPRPQGVPIPANTLILLALAASTQSHELVASIITTSARATPRLMLSTPKLPDRIL